MLRNSRNSLRVNLEWILRTSRNSLRVNSEWILRNSRNSLSVNLECIQRNSRNSLRVNFGSKNNWVLHIIYPLHIPKVLSFFEFPVWGSSLVRAFQENRVEHTFFRFIFHKHYYLRIIINIVDTWQIRWSQLVVGRHANVSNKIRIQIFETIWNCVEIEIQLPLFKYKRIINCKYFCIASVLLPASHSALLPNCRLLSQIPI